jgi:hypothetical protein
MQDNFDISCKGGATGGNDTWYAIFLFAGEELQAKAQVNSWMNGASGSFHILKVLADGDFCGALEQKDCHKIGSTLLSSPTISHTAEETGWYLVVFDGVASTTYIGSVQLDLYNCSYQEDCSCWNEADDPWEPPLDGGLDSGPDANLDAAANGS